MHHYVIKFVSYLQQVAGPGTPVPPPIKKTHEITEIVLKVSLNTLNQPNYLCSMLYKE